MSAANIARLIKKKPSKTASVTSSKTSLKTAQQALAAFYGAKKRSPLWVSKEGLKDASLFILAEFKHAEDYGLRARDFNAPQKLMTRFEKAGNTLTAKQLATLEISLSKTALKYIRYAKGGRINPKRLSRFQGRGPVQPDYEKALHSLASTDNPAELLLSHHPKHKQFEALRQKLVLLNDAGPKKKSKKRDKLRARLLINMERWRWMPEKMQGDNNIFVWANVPELRVRIIREGKQVFAERVIAGQVRKQSPMFSDKIEWIEFNPTWFIPNSIKVADILPSLRRKGRVMKKYHLRVNCGKHGTNWRTIDWKKVDIRSCSVIQPTGNKSVLGKLKFKFPNKYAVYMHDTLTPGLFNRKHRILSHGCIRVRNPRRMAEVLLANDKGMSATRIGTLLARGGLHTEHLKRAIPVHITYFSTRVQKNGSLKHFP
ncbi:MAG: L,D-transpeptidase family protein, partial [Hyphomicrobiaceae bacterium]|nr:L,D-transpeptidase family protein [Hyphomicrobiaceae bacterium]